MEAMQQLLEKAAKICLSVHAEQRDKAGKAYFLHPFRVAMNCDNDEEKIVALLHDTIEDGDIDADFFFKQGFPENIVEAILCLTRRESEEYNDFIKQLASNTLARKVKIKDLEDNLDILRLKELTQEDILRCNKYLNALDYLKKYKDFKETASSNNKKSGHYLDHNKSVQRLDSLFYLSGDGWDAKGQLTSDRRIIILKDSLMRSEVVQSFTSHKIREKILEQYCRIEEKGYRTTSDLPPMSPSTSSGIVQGRPSNGRVDWKDASGVALSVYLDTL